MFASSDEERLKQLRKALYAEDSSAVWCVRGGYGALRLMPPMWDWRAPERVKPLIGFSDITTLHSFLNGQWGWPSIHGPLLDRFGRGDNQVKETRELFGLLLGVKSGVEFKGLKFVSHSKRSQGKLIKGPVVGGNLAVIQSSIGTPYEVAPKGCIVFFEDVGERPHRVDRMLTQLIQAGYFNQVQAVVFGPMLVGQRRDHLVMWNEIMPRFARAVSFPVLRGMPVGHGDVQRPLPLFTSGVLDVNRGILTVSSGALSRD